MISHSPLSYSKAHILKPEDCFLTGSMGMKMKVFSRHIWLENDEMTLGKMKKNSFLFPSSYLLPYFKVR